MAEPFYESDVVRLFQGDMREALQALPANSIDAVITDPPYGLSVEPDMASVLKHWLAGDDYKHRGGGFMGNSWDSFVPGPSFWREVYRVLKPGGHLAAFAGTRTADLMGIAIRLAGFTRRDTILHLGAEETNIGAELAWLYGSGFPKEGDLGAAIDKQLGAEPEVLKREAEHGYDRRRGYSMLDEHKVEEVEATRTSGIGAAYSAAAEEGTWQRDAGQQVVAETTPSTEEGKRWRGWSTGLKPANEPIILARKPLSEKNIPLNVLKHGTGAINIQAAAIGEDERVNAASAYKGEIGAPVPKAKEDAPATARKGRWPANVVGTHTEECRRVGQKEMPVADTHVTGENSRAGHKSTFGSIEVKNAVAEDGKETIEVWECAPGCPVREVDAQGDEEIHRLHVKIPEGRGVAAGVSRFFYCAKPTTAERDAGILSEPQYVLNRAGGSGIARDERIRALVKEGMSQEEAEKHVANRKNPHQTVKPINLMRWLVALLTPPGGTVLDPFMGSGTTGCAVVLEDGYHFVGVELGEAFAEVCAQRIAHWEKVGERGVCDDPQCPACKKPMGLGKQQMTLV